MNHTSTNTNLLTALTLDSWVTADQHWGHERIALYQRRPANHFELMRERWLQAVRPEEVVLHLGDLVCFGDRSLHSFWVSGLPGRKLLLRGNHDRHTDAWYGCAGFEVFGRANKMLLWHSPRDGMLIAFSHERAPPGGWSVNIHGHQHGTSYSQDVPRKDYRCVSVEVTGYAPVRLRNVLYGEAGARRLPQ